MYKSNLHIGIELLYYLYYYIQSAHLCGTSRPLLTEQTPHTPNQVVRKGPWPRKGIWQPLIRTSDMYDMDHLI